MINDLSLDAINRSYGMKNTAMSPLDGASNNASIFSNSASLPPDLFSLFLLGKNPDLMSYLMFSNTMEDFDKFLLSPSGFNEKFNTETNLPALKNVYDKDLGNSLANIANKNAKEMNTIGYCARGTNKALELAGLANGETRVAAACQADGVLSKHKNFKEVKVSKDELKSLPAGCVIVWEASNGHPYGHIAVTLGNGKEASDHVQNLIVRDAKFSVFVPKKAA